MRILIDGSEAIARGAIHAGCTFFAGYPITPASSILHHMMKRLPPAGGTAVQGEDEIASIGFCIGAAMAGAKAMTATSGPGMSLYSENIGLAMMGEVPLVIVDVQRMGPATGGATTTAEGDVQFCRWITAGGYPLVVYAATNPADAYRLTMQSFRTAERLRTPVILLGSKELAMTAETVDLEEFDPGNGDRVSNDGIPLLRPIGADGLTRFTGSIHDERCIITSDPEKIDRKLKHLIRKIESRADDLALTQEIRGEGTTLVVAYGTSARAARAAVGRDLSLLVLHTLWPVSVGAIRKAAKGMRRIVVPELNAGQYADEIRRIVPEVEVVSVTRLDGGLIEPDRILEASR